MPVATLDNVSLAYGHVPLLEGSPAALVQDLERAEHPALPGDRRAEQRPRLVADGA